MYLVVLEWMKHQENMDDEKVKVLVEKRVYENTASECNKLRNLIHNVVGKNLAVLSQKEYDNVRK